MGKVDKVEKVDQVDKVGQLVAPVSSIDLLVDRPASGWAEVEKNCRGAKQNKF